MRLRYKHDVSPDNRGMNSWVRVAAFIHKQYELGLVILNRIRRRILLPVALWGGRDMRLLRNGQWVDASVEADAHTEWYYDAEAHRLTHTREMGTRTMRWPWLSVANADHDLSDFFAGLRVTAGHTLPKDKAFMLYAHQRGHLPHGTVTIVTRDGEEQVVHTYEEVSAPMQRSTSSEDVNYVR